MYNLHIDSQVESLSILLKQFKNYFDNATTQPAFSRLSIFAAWGVIVLGVILRLRQYFSGRSLWVDEAMLALNIIGRDFSGLFSPLDDNQGAPIAFLMLEKLVSTLWGNRDLALRLIPLLTGCLALILFYRIVNRILNPVGALAALGFFAINPRLIYYASEVKQYSSDVCVALALVWLALRAFEKETHKTKIFLGIFGIFALWLSHPALFVLAAIGMVMLFDSFLRRDRPAIFATLLIGAAWLISFGLLYFISLRQLASDSFLIEYWRESFGLNPLNAMLDLFSNAAGLDLFAPLLLGILLLGLASLFRRQRKAAFVLLLIFVFAMLASWLQKYPFSGRLMLFSVPFLLMLLGAGAGWVSSLRLRPAFVPVLLSITLIGWLLYAPAQTSFVQFSSPPYDEHIRPALSYLRANYQPDDDIYVYYWAVPAFRYYAPAYGFSERPFIAGQDAGLSNLLADVAQLKSHKRIWVLFSHLTKNGLEKRNAMLVALRESHNQTQKQIVPGTNVYLYLYVSK